jgi:uncharacterized protein (DUF2384 family)
MISTLMGDFSGARPVPAKRKLMAETERRILKIALGAFDDEAKAWRWLHEPNIQTGNQPPIEMIGTSQGFDAVETVLYQIQYAVMG